MGSGIGRPSGAKNMLLDKAECRPGIPASSCTELRPNSTHICSQHPRCATKAPAVLVTAARHLTSWQCSCTPRCASAGCWLLLVWLRPQTLQLWAFPWGCFIPGLSSSGATERGRTPRAPRPPGPARSPGPRRLWPRCWNGRAAPAAAVPGSVGRGGAGAWGRARNRPSPETHGMIRPGRCAIHTRRGGRNTLARLLVLEGPMVGFG